MNTHFRSPAFYDLGLDYEDRATEDFSGVEITYLIEELDTTYGLINAVRIEVDGDGEDFNLGKFEIQTNETRKGQFSGIEAHVFQTISQTSPHPFDVELCRAINAYVESHREEIFEKLRDAQSEF